MVVGIYHLYRDTTYSPCLLGGLYYATYHLLREPETPSHKAPAVESKSQDPWLMQTENFHQQKSGDHLNKKTYFLWLGKVLSFIFKFLQFYSLILFYNTHINCYCISSHTAVISNMKCLLLILTSILSFYRQPFVHDFVGGTPASRRPTLHRGPVV